MTEDWLLLIVAELSISNTLFEKYIVKNIKRKNIQYLKTIQ